jgi:tRNA (cmo5U34)-methyltransferase
MVQADNSTPYASSVYDQNVRQTIPFYETIHLETIDLVKTVKPDVSCWLDTGCGTGYLVEMALPLFPGAQFVLADPSKAMLAQAMERLKDVPEGRLKFLPLVQSEYLLSHKEAVIPQVITAVLCHHYLQPLQRQEAIRSCYQMLDDDGLFVTFENIEPCTLRGTQIGLTRWKSFQLRQGRTPSIVEDHAKRFKTKYFPITVNEHVELLRMVGFDVVELFWLSHMQAGFYAVK